MPLPVVLLPRKACVRESLYVRVCARVWACVGVCDLAGLLKSEEPCNMVPWTSENESVVSTWLQSTGAQELMSVVLVEPPAA